MTQFENPILRFELGIHGWSSLEIQHLDKSVSFTITHIFDDPVESLLNFIEDIEALRFPARIEFHDEPGMYALEIDVVDAAPPSLHILHSEKQFASPTQFNEIVAYRVDPSFIAAQIEADLFRIERLMNHKLYQENRSNHPLWKISKRRQAHFNNG